MRVLVPAAPPLATLVLRAPSAGLAMQYEAAVLRAMRSLRAWADAGEVTAEQTRALLSLPGGGAAEMQLAALCRGNRATLTLTLTLTIPTLTRTLTLTPDLT